MEIQHGRRAQQIQPEKRQGQRPGSKCGKQGEKKNPKKAKECTVENDVSISVGNQRLQDMHGAHGLRTQLGSWHEWSLKSHQPVWQRVLASMAGCPRRAGAGGTTQRRQRADRKLLAHASLLRSPGARCLHAVLRAQLCQPCRATRRSSRLASYRSLQLAPC